MSRSLKNIIWIVAVMVIFSSCTKDEEWIRDAQNDLIEKSLVTNEVISDDVPVNSPQGKTQGDIRINTGCGVDENGDGITDDDDDENDDDDGGAKRAKN